MDKRVSRFSILSLVLETLLGYVIGAGAQSPPAQPPQSTQTTQATQSTLDADFQRFVSWFGAEWNNNEQVWQQRIDAGKAKEPTSVEISPQSHHIFSPVDAPKIGANIYYVQQHLNGDMSKSDRQRIYRLSKDAAESAIKLEILNLNDEAAFFNAHLRPQQFEALEMSALRATPGCEVYWRYHADEKHYVGTMKPHACSFVSQRYGKRVFISDTLRLSENEIWINDQARDESGGYVFGSKTDTPVKARKVIYYTGWMTLNRAGPAGKAGDGNFSSRRDLLIHNEGQLIPILYDDGTPSPYLAELAMLTYQNTRTAILKLALVDRETKKSVTYIWSDTDAKRIGMNLGWFQMGFTQKEARRNFGFGDPPKSAPRAAATSVSTPSTTPAPTSAPAATLSRQ